VADDSSDDLKLAKTIGKVAVLSGQLRRISRQPGCWLTH